MKTRIQKKGDFVIVQVEGRMSFETQVPLKDSLEKIIDETHRDTAPKKIIFDLSALDFVGSSGISSFVQTLKDINQAAPTKPRYCNVKSEFQKIMKAYDNENLFEFFENEEGARESFSLPPMDPAVPSTLDH